MRIEIDFKRFFRNKRFVYASVIVFLLVIFIFIVFYIFFSTPPTQNITVLDISSPDSVITVTGNHVEPIIYTRIPDLQKLDTDERKKKFINIVLPAALLAQKIIKTKREEFKIIKRKKILTPQDSSILDSTLIKFNAKDIDDLISRLHSHPVSIIIAQAATESGWGTSRFCREANNIFGVWSFSKNEPRIAAGKTRDEKVIFLRKYDSLIGSIIDYLYTIAKSDAYKTFRQKRTISDNPYRLIWFLQNYSEKRLEYVIILRNMLEHNDLSRYDSMTLPAISEKDKTWQELLKKY